MQKIILPIIAIVMTGLPLTAADNDIREEFHKQFREKYNILLRVGVDALGGEDDTETIGTGKKGADREMGYELVMGVEKKVENFEFGTRRTMTLYNFGDTTYYNGTYLADIDNFGIETTGATYFKATQYVKPYVGIGLGINVNRYNDHGVSVTSESFQPTVHIVGGVSGELFVGIGYYAEYKYRYSNTIKEQATVDNGGTLELVEIENKGVTGGQFMAGVSYQF